MWAFIIVLMNELADADITHTVYEYYIFIKTQHRIRGLCHRSVALAHHSYLHIYSSACFVNLCLAHQKCVLNETFTSFEL